jgi:hypothetical protein
MIVCHSVLGGKSCGFSTTYSVQSSRIIRCASSGLKPLPIRKFVAKLTGAHDSRVRIARVWCKGGIRRLMDDAPD